MIKIHLEERIIEDCVSVIIAPERAIAEPGYIKTLTAKNDASSKHEFSAMAQMAYYQYQDDELEIIDVFAEMQIEHEGEKESLQDGVLMYRDTDSGFHVLMHQGLNKKKLLETVHRFCTRWVRLDI